MHFYFRFTVVTSVVLLASAVGVAGCSDAPAGPVEPEVLTLEQRVEEMESPPPGVNDKIVAWFLAIGDLPRPYNYSPHRYGLVMWQGPLRIAVEDGNGRDFDLSTYPGSAIKYLITSFATYSGFPVEITTVDRHDNNASFVISKDRMIADAGTLYGVPELSARPHDRMSGVLQDFYQASLDQSNEWSIGQFTLGYVRKACVANLVIPDGGSVDSKTIENGVGGLLHLCIGQMQSSMGFPESPPVAYQYGLHNFYYWNMLYNSGVKPGTEPQTALDQLLDFLKRRKTD